MTAPRTLVVMRHGKSSWKTNDPDIDRPLNPRGTRDAVVAGQILAPLGFDLALVSPAARAQQTWQCLEMGGTAAAEVRTLDALYHAWTPQLLAALRALPAGASRVLMIGHEPTLSDLILTLTPASASRDEIEAKFPTSAVAVLTTQRAWAELGEDAASIAAYEVPRG